MSIQKSKILQDGGESCALRKYCFNPTILSAAALWKWLTHVVNFRSGKTKWSILELAKKMAIFSLHRPIDKKNENFKNSVTVLKGPRSQFIGLENRHSTKKGSKVFWGISS